jgi:hypothetical protein
MHFKAFPQDTETMVPAVWIEHTTYRLQASSKPLSGTLSGLPTARIPNGLGRNESA